MSAPAVGVVSFPRAGSSMTMRMLHAGGVEPVDGTQPGSYELSSFEAMLAARPAGYSIKLLDSFLQNPAVLDTADSWKFIWLDRNPHQQARSQLKLMRTLAPGLPIIGGDAAGVLARSLRADRHRALSLLRARGPVLSLHFESILDEPHGQPDLSIEQAIA